MEKRSGSYSLLHKCSSGRHLPNDQICSLPDEVLLIILSFLPLKDMVKTSILSRRWLNLWVNTPVLENLDLAGGCYYTIGDYFVQWVDHVLHQHKGLYLKKFRVCCNLLCDYQEDIDRWLEFALARRVEILELDFMSFGFCNQLGPIYVLNDYWFSCGKANVDGSKSRVLQFNLKFLKSLSLKNVTVTDEAVNDFLRNCPLLERLELCGSKSSANIVISDPTLVLKHLQIKHCPKIEVLSISNFNLVSLDTTVGNLILTDLCQLEILKLYVNKLKEVTELLSNLAQLTKLKRLVINYLAYADEPLLELLPAVKSCNHLEELVLELHQFKA